MYIEILMKLPLHVEYWAIVSSSADVRPESRKAMAVLWLIQNDQFFYLRCLRPQFLSNQCCLRPQFESNQCFLRHQFEGNQCCLRSQFDSNYWNSSQNKIYMDKMCRIKVNVPINCVVIEESWRDGKGRGKNFMIVCSLQNQITERIQMEPSC